MHHTKGPLYDAKKIQKYQIKGKEKIRNGEILDVAAGITPASHGEDGEI